MQDITNTLHSCGLNDREIQVYLTLLGIGQAPASVIARRTGIPKSTVKYACVQLSKKGFLQMIQKDKAHMFVAEEPERILFIFEREREAVTKRENQMRKIIAPLKQMMCPQLVLPAVRFYEGINGVLEATLGFVRDTPEGSEILSFLRPMGEEDLRHLPPGVTPAELAEGFEHQFRERMRRSIRKRMIALRTPVSESWKALDKVENRETRLVDDLPSMDTPVEILLSEDRMLAASVHNGSVFAFRLEHGPIVALYRAMFEVAWSADGKPR